MKCGQQQFWPYFFVSGVGLLCFVSADGLLCVLPVFFTFKWKKGGKFRFRLPEKSSKVEIEKVENLKVGKSALLSCFLTFYNSISFTRR